MIFESFKVSSNPFKHSSILSIIIFFPNFGNIDTMKLVAMNRLPAICHRLFERFNVTNQPKGRNNSNNRSASGKVSKNHSSAVKENKSNKRIRARRSLRYKSKTDERVAENRRWSYKSGLCGLLPPLRTHPDAARTDNPGWLSSDSEQYIIYVWLLVILPGPEFVRAAKVLTPFLKIVI